MSVRIHWRPATDKGKSFEHGTSTTLERLVRAFGHCLDETHVPKLRAMAIAAEDSFYNEVADIVEQVGTIEIWGEY